MRRTESAKTPGSIVRDNTVWSGRPCETVVGVVPVFASALVPAVATPAVVASPSVTLAGRRAMPIDAMTMAAARASRDRHCDACRVWRCDERTGAGSRP